MRPLTYGSVCSGMEAATLAWHGLGWRAAFYSEIERFPRLLLKHHYPTVPLFGDFTAIRNNHLRRLSCGTIDLLVGGTPCQSFSVAGKRLGLDDPRGNLSLEYLKLGRRLRARWLVFENVPGLLSLDGGDAFAAFISAATGYDYATPPDGWKNAGIAEGKPGHWGIAWRVLDAQYFGVAQRRRRVFVVGYTGNWRPAAAVLLEPESMRGDSPPRREKRARAAGTLASRASSGGGLGTDFESDGGLIAAEVASTLPAGGNTTGGNRFPGTGPETAAGGYLVAMSTGQGGAEISEDNVGPTLTCNHEAPIVAHTLRGEGFDASEDGTGRGTPLVPVAFQSYASATQSMNPGAVAPTLDVAKAGGAAVAYPLDLRNAGRDPEKQDEQNRQGVGIGEDGDPCGTVSASFVPGVVQAMAVRRLTPRECERLQGAPDDYTLVPVGGKMASDGPRYKVVGNSKAIPVVTWIGERIAHVDAVMQGAA